MCRRSRRSPGGLEDDNNDKGNDDDDDNESEEEEEEDAKAKSQDADCGCRARWVMGTPREVVGHLGNHGLAHA